MAPGGVRVLACRAGGERLALPAAALDSIQPPAPLTRVPRAPDCLLGMASLRGAAVPVVSLARLLGREEAPAGRAARLLLLRGRAPMALAVEAVLGLADDAAPLALEALLARAFAAPAAPAAPLAPARPDPMPACGAVGGAVLSLLRCRVAGQDFALPLEAVETVLRLPPGFAPMPGLGHAALGVLPHRGRPLPLLSLAALLGRGAALPGHGARILVLCREGARAGLVVEAVRGTLAVPEAAVEPVPPILAHGLGEGRVAAIARLEEGRRLLPILAPAPLLEGAPPAPAAEAAEVAPLAAGEGERVLLLRLGERDFALPLAAVEEVRRATAALARLPQAPGETPEGLAGLMTLRGEPLPVMDLRRLLGLPPAAWGGRVVVARLDGLRVALAVDAVPGLRSLPRAALAASPRAAGGAAPLVEAGASLPDDAGVVLLLSPAVLLGEADSALCAALAGAEAARAARLATARAAAEGAA